MRYLVALLIFLSCTHAFAGEITGTLSFLKKAPFVGVIYVVDNKSGPQKVTVDQKNKKFTKKLAVVGPGGSLKFTNSDDFQHNIFANDPATGVKFDVGLMETGQSSDISVDWDKSTLTRVGCKIHPRMRTYIANIPSDTYQILDFEKKQNDYSIKLAINNTTNNIVLMIPKYDKLEFTLAPGEKKTLEVTRKGKKKASLTISHQ